MFYNNSNYDESSDKIKKIRTCGNFIGIGFALSILASVIFSSAFTFFIGITNNFNVKNAFGGSDPVLYYLFSGIVTIFSLLIPFIAVSKLMNKNLFDLVTFDKINIDSFVSYVLMGLAICVFAENISFNFTNNIKEITFLNPKTAQFPYDNNIISIVLNVVTLCILTPLVEEFVFRGVILGALKEFGSSFAILISAGIFGLMHLNLSGISFAFIIGIFLGYVVVKTNSILPAIIIHSINNLNYITCQIIQNNLNSNICTIYENIFNIVIIILGIIAFVYILNRKRAFFEYEGDIDETFPLKRKINTFLMSPLIILFLVIMLIKVIATVF